MSQRERRAGVRQLVLEIVKQVIKEKMSKLEAKGYTTISSREIYGRCVKKFEEEDKCIGITTYAARLLNKYAERIESYKAKWRITTRLLEKLFNLDTSYQDLNDIPLADLDGIHFLYIVTSLLYEAKPEGDQNG